MKIRKNKASIFLINAALFIILVGAVVCVLTRISFHSDGFETVINAADLASMDIQIEYAWGQGADQERYAQDLLDDMDEMLKTIGGASAILVVEPTGNICQHRDSFSQEVEIVDIISNTGTEVEKEVRIQIIGSGGFKCVDDKIYYTDVINIMYPQNTYLVFLNESDLNVYEQIHDYYFAGLFTPCINLNQNRIQKPCLTGKLSEYVDTDYFAASTQILDSIIEIEQEALAHYATGRNLQK